MSSSEQSWNLAPLFSSPADPAWEQALTDAARKAKSFRRDFRGRIAAENLSADLLAAALRGYQDLQQTVLLPYLYAQLLFSANSEPDEHKALVARVREAWSDITEQTLFFELEIFDKTALFQILKYPDQKHKYATT